MSAPVAPPLPTALLLDANILLGLLAPTHHNAASVREAVAQLENLTQLCVAPQTLVEFYAVATRERQHNGFGWKPENAAQAVDDLRVRFQFLPENSAVFAQWRQLIETHRITSKSAHDTKIAATALVYGTGLLTANVAHFKRFKSSGLVIVNPIGLVVP